MRSVSPEYFDTVGLPLLEGRNFRTKEAFDWPRLSGATNEAFAVIINQAMAERHFSGRNPVGHNLHFSFENVHAEANIIGIVANSHDEALSQQAAPGLYFSFWQLPPGTKHLVVRAVSNPRSVIANVERELRRVDPGVVVQDVKTFEQIRSGSIAPQLFAMRLLTGFSFLASAVAVIGIYGVLSLSVASRRREFAIRAALGAQRRAILSLVIGFGLRIVGIGVVLGMGVALVLMGFFRGLLFGVSPTDLPAFAGAAMLFAGVALVACSIPARRAANANPMAALRDE
jgi:putative ABC transport system permease protein